MEKKRYSRLVTLLLSGVLLVGCGNQAAAPTNETENTESENVAVADEKVVTIGVYVDGELIEDSDTELAVEEDQNVLEIMDTHYDIEATDGFMTAIEGYEQDEAEGLYWMYYVNDEMPSVGAEDYVPEPADEIEWKLESFE